MIAILIFGVILLALFAIIVSKKTPKSHQNRPSPVVPESTLINNLPEQSHTLQKVPIVVPWRNIKKDNIVSTDELNDDQIQFYTYFKDAFIKEVYWDLEGNNNYAFLLLHEFVQEHKHTEQDEHFRTYLTQLGLNYPATKIDVIKQLLTRLPTMEGLEVLVPDYVYQKRKALKSLLQVKPVVALVTPAIAEPVAPTIVASVEPTIVASVEPTIAASVAHTIPASGFSNHISIISPAATRNAGFTVIPLIKVPFNSETIPTAPAISDMDKDTSNSNKDTSNSEQVSIELAIPIPETFRPQQEDKSDNTDPVADQTDTASPSDVIIDVTLPNDEDAAMQQIFQRWLDKIDVIDSEAETILSVPEPASTTFTPSISDEEERITLGTLYSRDLRLDRTQEKLLNEVIYYPNNFNEIGACRKAIVSVFLQLVTNLNQLFQWEQPRTSFIEQVESVAGTIATKVYRFRAGSDNYRYMTEQASRDIKQHLFKLSENAVREHYRHKRKLSEIVDYAHPVVQQEYENRLLHKVRTALPILVRHCTALDSESEILLNAINTTRWKAELDLLEQQFLPNNCLQFLAQVTQLGKRNERNPSLEIIYFDAAKMVGKLNKEISLELYLRYVHADLNSETFDNRQLNKTSQRHLFTNQEQYQDFESLVDQLIKTRDLEKALQQARLIYLPKRKRINLDKIAISAAINRDIDTVNLLNTLLLGADEQEENNTIPESISEPKFISSVTPNTISDRNNNASIIHFEAEYTETLTLFVKSNYAVAKNDLQQFARLKGLFYNQLVNHINEASYDLLNDNLIEEEDNQYILNQQYYQQLFTNDREYQTQRSDLNH